MKYALVILSLWLIAILTTLIIVQDAVFSILGPVFALCTIGSVFTVRHATGERPRGASRA